MLQATTIKASRLLHFLAGTCDVDINLDEGFWLQKNRVWGRLGRP